MQGTSSTGPHRARLGLPRGALRMQRAATTARRRGGRLWVWLPLLILCAGRTALAENIAPGNDGSKYDNPHPEQSCVPAETCTDGGGTTGGQACALTVAVCNAQVFSTVDPVTCTCYGNYKP